MAAEKHMGAARPSSGHRGYASRTARTCDESTAPREVAQPFSPPDLSLLDPAVEPAACPLVTLQFNQTPLL
jgi:hypothetical protein